MRKAQHEWPEVFVQARQPLIALFCALALPLSASAGQADRDTLKKAVEQLLSQPPLAGAHVGMEVQSLDDGQTVFSRNGEDLLNPASNTKLITGAAALSLNPNAVAIYITPGTRTGQRARIEVDPDAREYFTLDSRVITVRAGGRRKLRPHSIAEGERTRIVVEGRLPKGGETVVMYRRIGDPGFYYGQ